jgi:hypothetical protein
MSDSPCSHQSTNRPWIGEFTAFVLADDKRLQQSVRRDGCREFSHCDIGTGGLANVAVPGDEFIQWFRCSVIHNGPPLLEVFRDAQGRAAGQAARVTSFSSFSEGP